jgi:general secretion pathway protein L
MNEFLVIRPDPPPGQTASWIAVDETGALLGPPMYGDLPDAVPAAAGREIIALVSAPDVLRTRVEVPVKGGAAKLLQAVPFALEEQLAEDLDALHFAIGSREADGRMPVAVVRRETIDALCARLSGAGLAPHGIYAESDAIAGMPNTLTLLVQDSYSILTEPDGSVTALDTGELSALLDLWFASREKAGGENIPSHLVVYGSPQALSSLESVWQDLTPRVESLEVRSLSEGALPRLAAQIVTAPGINLLQGSFAQKSSLWTYWPAWRIAAMLLVAVVALGLVTQVAQLRRMRGEIAALDRSIDQAFHYVFPDAGPIQDARAQLSSRLQELGGRGGAGSHEFLDALRVIAQAVSSTGQARVEAVNYRTGTMELRIRAPTVETLDRIQQQVTQAGGLKAQIQSANASDNNEVIGRLQITRAGS